MNAVPPRISVFVMAFNEAASLPETVRELHEVLSCLGQPFDLAIINDGSTDETGALAEHYAREFAGVRVIHHARNGGLGAVYRTGFAQARGEFVTFFPADGQFPATIITQLLPLMASHDLVFGYLPQRRDALVARFLSSIERMLYRVLFGPMPRFQGILMFRRELLARFSLCSGGRSWVVLMEFIWRAVRGGARYCSEPTTLRPRQHGASKVNNWRTIAASLRQIVSLLIALRKEK